ncbi:MULTISPECIES: DUF72 domain-containing protein [unclassified Flavobacterium]|uniref:DUF72 domain-containing protein n=1 Tax=unclassified Flavobacterium TaxID=196869 RepID=UPI003F9005A8
MSKKIQIGCSSFYNRKWVPIFYPENLPSKNWFEYYSNHFSTFEINATFYKFPTLRIMENWYAKSPENYSYSVKAPKEITHLKKFKDCVELIDKLYSVCESGLKEKLGCLLFQFPPSYAFSKENLDTIVSSLNPKYKNIVEFRNDSWWNDEVINTLTANNISFCSVSHPKLPQHIVTQSPVIYLRLHGAKKLFYSEYTTEELEYIKYQLVMSETKKEVFIYFNNTASEAGIKNAQLMKKILE